jgi:hypothetical protein
MTQQALKGVPRHFPNSPIIRVCSRFLKIKKVESVINQFHMTSVIMILRTLKVITFLCKIKKIRDLLCDVKIIVKIKTKNGVDEGDYGFGWKSITKNT